MRSGIELMRLHLLALAVTGLLAVDTPPTADEIGNAGWALLHTVTLAYPEQPTEDDKLTMNQFFASFAKVYPCHICSGHFQQLLAQNPPRIESRETLSQWLCEAHNNVNRRLGKAEFPCTSVQGRWLATYPAHNGGGAV